MVEVQKPMVLRFLTCSRDPLRGSAWSRCKNSRFFATFVVRTGPRELSRGSRACSRAGRSRVRFLPGPRAGVARRNLHFKATCADQLAPTSLRRAPCLEQLAQSNLRRATCTEQLAQSSLRRATCRERNLHNLRRATYAEQFAQSNLH